MRKKLSISLLAVLAFCGVLLSSCDNKTNDNTPKTEEGGGNSSKETCVVKFENTNLANQTVDKDSKLQKPAEPTKDNKIFGGWYLDSLYQTEATFPLTISSNTSIYAKFYSYSEAFLAARDKTIGNEVASFEYDYTVDATATATIYGISKSLTGNTTGNVKYNKNGDISYYDNNVSSGALFYDGSKYQIKEGNKLQKIAVDENDLIRSYSVEEVDSSYKVDTSSFAKAVFEFDEAKIKSITKTNTKDEYKLSTTMTISEALKFVGKYVNSSIVESKLGNLPDTSINTGIYVKFSDGKLLSYRYVMDINVSAITFNLTYNMTFKNIGVVGTITPKAFTGLSLTNEQINQTKTEVNTILNSYLAKAHSGYNFEFKMGVDFDSSNEINATFQGSTKRKVDSSVYFHNDIEIDSDFKNADLYKSAGIADVHIKKTRLSNGDVYNIEKKLLKDDTTLINNYVANDTDSYYLLKAFNSINNFTFIQKTTVSKTNETVYSIGLGKASVKELLNFFNNELNLDPLSKASVQTRLFGTFDENSIDIDEVKFTIRVNGANLVLIEIESDGKFKTKYEGSRDFTNLAEAHYDFKYKIEFTTDGDSFEPYETVNKAK